MQRPRPVLWLRAHPTAADVLLAIFLVIFGIVAAIVGPRAFPHQELNELTWWAVPLVIGSTAGVAWRRTRPVISLGFMAVCQAALNVAVISGAGWVGVLVGLYSVAAYVPSPRNLRMATVFGCCVLGFIGFGIASGESLWGEAFGTTVSFTTAFVLGDNVRRRRERLAFLTERADRAERERDLVARERVNEERTRIARELHDVVAHSLSVMVIQAGAARKQVDRNPRQATTALIDLENTGRSAMNEMRRVLGVLRTGDAGTETQPLPGLADLPALLRHDEDLPVSFSASGETTAVPVSTQLAAYRVVQEALTNVRKHAGPVQRVDVVVTSGPGELSIEVADDGRGASTVTNGATVDGFGITGMRERVEAVAGRLVAGPRPGGGWRIRAIFPVVAS